jgi:hypothetical protein
MHMRTTFMWLEKIEPQKSRFWTTQYVLINKYIICFVQNLLLQAPMAFEYGKSWNLIMLEFVGPLVLVHFTFSSQLKGTTPIKI